MCPLDSSLSAARARTLFAMNGTRQLVFSFVLAVSVLSAVAQPVADCGNVREAGFEKDYRAASREERHIVESFHFTAEVEALIRGKSGSLMQDLAYTLRHFPNHHRALASLTRLGERARWRTLPDLPYTIDCYFRRAAALARDDGVVYSLYAIFLFRTDRTGDAFAAIDRAIEIAGENGLAHYNIGLVLLEQSQFERALTQAHRAAALGVARTDLRDRLAAAGKWRERESELASTAAKPLPPGAAASDVSAPLDLPEVPVAPAPVETR
jgi:tetratricopeptide (TPR) repeat protein